MASFFVFSNGHMKSSLALLFMCGVFSVFSVRAGNAATQPVTLKLINPSFEESPNAEGWVHRETTIVDDREPNVNRAKDGTRWLLLPPASSAGQRLGRWVDLIAAGAPKAGDRFFTAFTLSSLQDADDATSSGAKAAPFVKLKVGLWLSSSTESWEGGQELTHKTLEERANHVRGDLNSYIDGAAVLSVGQEAHRQGDHYWLVFTNAAEPGKKNRGGGGSATIDLVSVTFSTPPPQHLGVETRPNLLIALQDDLGFGDVSSFNRASKIVTPNIDRLVAQGMRFTDAHSGATICGPSRVALLTGTLPSKLGVHGNFVTPRASLGPPTIPTGTATIASMCRNQVYVICMCAYRLISVLTQAHVYSY